MSNEIGGRLPDTPAAFGVHLRALRGRRSLRRLEADQERAATRTLVISKSQLARYEAGQTVPPLEYAAHLDDLYRAEGWVEVALRGLWRSRWDPWASTIFGPSQIHSAVWPAALSGVVWLKVKPAPDNARALHHFEFEWGPWIRRIETPIENSGVLFFTGKAVDADGIAHTFNITCNKRVFLLYGANDNFEGESTVIDLRRGWRIAPGESRDTPGAGSQMLD